MSGQVVGNVRVSSLQQNPDRQVLSIGEVEGTITDTVSGKSRADRPALAEMLRHVRRHDTVRVASMDRLARSVIDLDAIVRELTARGVTVEFVTERLTFGPDGEDPFATFQLHLLGAVAQLERSLIRERQREGIEIAKTKGVYKGRARKLSPEQVDQVRLLVASGVPRPKSPATWTAPAESSTTSSPAPAPTPSRHPPPSQLATRRVTDSTRTTRFHAIWSRRSTVSLDHR